MKVMQPSSSLELGLDMPGQPGRDTGPEAFIAKSVSESPTGEVRLMESILERENMQRAMRRVRENDGAPGIDGMTVEELPRYLVRHWERIKADLLAGLYKPSPVRRTEIPKPNGGVRLLGIPTVLDRLIQQAVAQVLQAIWDHTFSECSYGFRPKRSQHMAIRKAQDYIKGGCRQVPDDLPDTSAPRSLLNEYIKGWWGYFAICEARTCLIELNAWVLRRLRAYIWKQWKLPKTKLRELRKRGLPDYLARPLAATRKGAWHSSENGYLARALPTVYFIRSLGLVLPG